MLHYRMYFSFYLIQVVFLFGTVIDGFEYNKQEFGSRFNYTRQVQHLLEQTDLNTALGNFDLLRDFLDNDPILNSPTGYSTGNESNCLRVGNITDDQLNRLRSAYQIVFGSPKQYTSLDTFLARKSAALAYAVESKQDYELLIPNVGTYVGIEAAAEYEAVLDGTTNAAYYNELYAVVTGTSTQFGSPSRLRAYSRDHLNFLQLELVSWLNQSSFSPTLFQFDFHMRPCSLRFHKVDVQFHPASVDLFVQNMFSDEILCQRIQQFCVGGNQQYDNVDSCTEFMNQIGRSDPTCDAAAAATDVPYTLKGNTTNCRFLHHFMAAINPEAHCPHVGKGKPDLMGNVKCSELDCAVKETRYATYEEGTGNIRECTLEQQVLAEKHLVGVLPYCTQDLKSMTNGTFENDLMCSSGCLRALNQFALFNDEYPKNTQYRFPALTAALSCTSKINENPLSVVLSVTRIPVQVILRICDTKPIEMEKVDYVHDIGQHDTLVKVFQGLQASPNAIQEQYPEVLLIDRDFLASFVDSAKFAIEFRDDTDHSYCPMFHGAIISSYRDVLEVIKSDQQRTSHATLTTLDTSLYGRALNENSHTLSSTGSVSHLLERAAMMVGFPHVWDTNVQFPKLVRAEHNIFPQDVAKTSATVIQNFFKVFFPSAAPNVLDDFVTSFIGALPSVPSVTSKSKGWDAAAGFLNSDAYVLFHREIVKLLKENVANKSWFNDATYLAGLAGLVYDKSMDEIASDIPESLANSLLAAGAFTVGLQAQILQTMSDSQPCDRWSRFKRRPYQYIKESLRLNPLPGIFVDLSSEYSFVKDRNGRHGNWSNSMPRTIHASFVAANLDPTVFPDPHKFDETRKNLDQIIVFNAPEYVFESGIPGIQDPRPEARRACPAHDTIIRFLVETTEILIPNDAESEAICGALDRANGFVLLDTLLLITGTVFCVGLVAGVSWICWISHATGSLVGKPFISNFQSILAKNVTVKEPNEREVLIYLQELSMYAKQKQSLRSPFYSSKGNDYVQEKNVVDRNNAVRGNYSVILDKVSLKLRKGTVSGLVGHSGAGKTSLLTVLSEEIHTTGVRLDGSRWTRPGCRTVLVHSCINIFEWQSNISLRELILAELFIRAEGIHNIGSVFECLVNGVVGPDSVKNTALLLQELGLESKLDTQLCNLSSGEFKRLEVLLACLGPSDVLLLDEPTSGLDSMNADRLVTYLHSIAKHHSKCIVMSIHQPSDALLSKCDQIIVAQQGVMHTMSHAEALQTVHGEADRKYIHGASTEDDSIVHRLLSGFHEGIRSAGEAFVNSSKYFDAKFNHYVLTDDDGTTLLEAPPTTRLPSLRNRIVGLSLHRWFRSRRQFRQGIFTTSAILALAALFGIPNIGDATQGVEVGSQLSIASGLLVYGYVILEIGSLSLQMFQHHARRLQGDLTGVDFGIELMVWHVWHSSAIVALGSMLSYGIGVSEYLDIVSALRIMVLTVIMASSSIIQLLSFTIVYFASLNKTISIDSALTASVHIQSFFAALMGLCWTFSGFLYRLDSISMSWFYAGVTCFMPLFWCNWAIIVVAISDVRFNECENSLLCHGDVFIASLLPKFAQPLVPAWAVVIVLCQIVGYILLTFFFAATRANSWKREQQKDSRIGECNDSSTHEKVARDSQDRVALV